MIGTQIGHLAITRLLGEGGMGAVYCAEHDILGTQRAVKVLLPQWTADAGMVQRFVNEARAAASIKHRNIIGVHDCGQLPGGAWFIVMDYLQGETLGQFSARYARPVPPALALQILAATANGLEAAHRAGIVHRDLKPDNVFLIAHEHARNRHHPVILDFGIAKLGEREGGALTRTGMMAGTPAYMAPEQMRSFKTVDRRSDVYALGVIAYQLITGGALPYAAAGSADDLRQRSAAELYHLVMTTSPVDARERVAAVPAGWAAAIRAALDVDPDRRPQSPRALALLLAESTEGDAFALPGTDIVRTYASELLEIGNLLETVRAPKPAGHIPGAPRAQGSRYQLGECLGAGGMAEVFRGTMIGAEGFARAVAVKRVLPALSSAPQFSSMFIDEAQLAARLTHENIVSVLDFDRDAEGRLFLVMEYVEGCDLARLAATGRLPPAAINFIASQALRGLGYAHELPAGGPVRGVIHRDVSPQNILLSWEGAVKVSDFGIAKAREASAATGSALIKGKVHYMSPEQANGDRLDGRADLFAIGVILWELLAGRPLFQGTSREVLAQVLFRKIEPPRAYAPDVPADLEAVAMRLLANAPADRYSSAGAAIEDLARCADAPRNGPAVLARLLAERFPEAAAARAEGGGSGAAAGGGRPSQVTARDPVGSPPARAARQLTAAQTTLGELASQAMGGPVAGRRRRGRALAAVAGATALAAIGALWAATSGGDAPSAARAGSAAVAGAAAALAADGAARATPAEGARAGSGARGAAAGSAAAVAPPEARAEARAAAGSAVAAGSAAAAAGSAAPVAQAVAAARAAAGSAVAAGSAAAAAGSAAPVAQAVAAASAAPVARAAPASARGGGAGGARAGAADARGAGPGAAPRAVGELSVHVEPWATVYVNGRRVGQSPYRGRLPVGRYSVRIKNEDVDQDETVIVTVSTSAPATVRRKW